MSKNDESGLRNLPSVETILRESRVAALVGQYGRPLVTYAVRRAVGEARVLAREGEEIPGTDDLAVRVTSEVESVACPSLKPVINATGVILHTNLGRAPMGQAVLDEIAPVMSGYSNLELDLVAGKRGHRSAHFLPIVRYLTGAEDALAVNNNAAGLILVLSTLARNREVIISRGELIEIGGAFRIPEIMAASGARMVEVGTTNRTRLSDYERALTDETAIIFKAHTSNYSIVGFTEEVPVTDLARFAHEHGLVMVYDIGSGLLCRPAAINAFGVEPDVRGALGGGADLVTFSCDKLLGGPQAGIVAGKEPLIAQLAKAPLMRALRVGKLTVAALGSACRRYLDIESLLRDNPAFAMFATSPSVLMRRAERLRSLLQEQGVAATVVEDSGQSGGGSMPNVPLSSSAVELVSPSETAKSRERFAEGVYQSLLRVDKPVLGILREGRVLFDVLTIFEEDLPYTAQQIARAAIESAASIRSS